MSIDALALLLAFGSSVSAFTASTQPQHHPTSLGATSFPYSGSVRPGKQAPQRTVPEGGGILIPSYAEDGIPREHRNPLPWMVQPKTEKEITKMRAAGKLARQVLDLAGRAVEVGVTTEEIDTLVHQAILEVSDS